MPAIKENFEIPDILRSIYREMDISPIGVLKNYALNLVYSKIYKYEAEVLNCHPELVEALCVNITV